MGLIVIASGLVGLLIGLGIAGAVLAGFLYLKASRKRGNTWTFLGWAILGMLLAFVIATAAMWPSLSELFNDSTSGEPNWSNILIACFVVGLSPAGAALGLLALTAKKR